MQITKHAIQRYRERFCPFLTVNEVHDFLLFIFDSAYKLNSESCYYKGNDSDYYLNQEHQIICVVKDRVIVTVYPTPTLKDELSMYDLNKIYLIINELREHLKDYKGHKTPQLKELEEMLNKRRA